MGVRRLIRSRPAYRQLTGPDRLGRGSAARSPQTEGLRARTDAAERIVKSVCPYCAVGCGQQVYVKDGAVVQIEGDQDSPVSRGRLCPKGSATLQPTTGSARRHAVLYRPPYAADWERLDLETAMDMVADFSGLDENGHHYDPASWRYEGAQVQAPAGDPDQQYAAREEDPESRRRVGAAGGSETRGSGGAQARSTAPRDETLQHPRCVYQVLKRHYARYTAAFVEETCGVPQDTFREVCDALTSDSGRDRGVHADGVNQAARRKPGREQDWVAAEWAWAWPANRRTLYNRTSAAPDGRPWSHRKSYLWWDPEERRWTGHDVPDFPPELAPEDASGPAALRGDDPFIMQADGKGWLYAPVGLEDGRDEPGTEVFPYVVTTHRLTEHFTAGGMSLWSLYLAELQPEFFCEISPEPAAERDLEHGGWATLVTARGAVEARVLVTRRIRPLTVQGRTVHQIGLPFHWGPNDLATGHAANELVAMSLDPNAHIQEDKAVTADIVAGRRPRGPELPRSLAAYRARAGITEQTGAEAVR